MPQEELLGVFSSVVDHAHPCHEIYQLLPRGVVQVVPALVASVAVDPLQPELAARRCFIRHVVLIRASSQLERAPFIAAAKDAGTCGPHLWSLQKSRLHLP